MQMSQLAIPSDAFDLAQELQLDMLGLPFDRRIERAQEALELLSSAHQPDVSYLVDSERAFAQPYYKFGKKVSLISFGATAVEGTLDTFSFVQIGKVDRMAIQALCATFKSVRFLPDGEAVNPHDDFHVPVLAINTAFEIAA